VPATPTLDQLAEDIVDIIPRLEETDQRIGVALIRRLAKGAPVAFATLAADVAMPETEVAERMDRMPGLYRDDDGRVVGYFGITVVEMGKHRLHLDGHTVSAWCAWDTLFLPDVLGRTVAVTSRSPNDDDPISLTVTAEGPRDVTPPETVVTFAPPSADFVNDTIASFCHYVHFFPSPGSAAKWTAEHPDTFAVPLADAYELAEVLTQTVFGSVVPTREERRGGSTGARPEQLPPRSSNAA
jgi:alkylmercury lyase